MDEETAAVRIQYWWRKVLRDHAVMAARKLERSEILQFSKTRAKNDKLVERMRALEISRLQSEETFNRIMSTSASHVDKVAERQTMAEKLERLRRRNESRKRNTAAKKIQKEVRSYLARKRSKRDKAKWSNVPPKQRTVMVQRVDLRNRIVEHFNPVVVQERFQEHVGAVDCQVSRWYEHQLRVMAAEEEILRGLRNQRRAEIIEQNAESEIPHSSYQNHQRHLDEIRQRAIKSLEDEVLGTDSE